MKTFAGQQVEPLFQFSWLVVLLSLMLCSSVALVLGFTVDPKLSIATSLSILALLYVFFGKKLTCYSVPRHVSKINVAQASIVIVKINI